MKWAVLGLGICLAMGSHGSANSAQKNDDLTQKIEKDWDYLNKLYRHLHQNPEVSFQERETAKRIAKELELIGFDVTKNVGGHGVVAVLKNGEGPTVLVRTDLDGLPILEQTNLPYASKKKMTGRDGHATYTMHACGHDVHMTVFTGTARRLMESKHQWSGTLVMIGQAAEERSGGAKAMLADGLFTKYPRPDYNLALHVSSDIEAGAVAAASGYAMANVDSVDIIVKGQGGHGAYPQKTKDPIVLAAQIIQSLQTIVSREISPLDPAVVTVGSIHGGSQHNIISNEVKLQLTLRSYSKEVQEHTLSAIRRMTTNLARAAGLPDDLLPVVTVLDESTPSVYNSPELTQKMMSIFRETVGSENVFEIGAEMVGEDFGRYGQVEPKIPSLLFRLGTVNSETFAQFKKGDIRLPTLHSADYAPDPKPSIITGIKTMTKAVMSLMNKK